MMSFKKTNFFVTAMLFIACLAFFNSCNPDETCDGSCDGLANVLGCEEATGDCICEFGWYNDGLGGICNKVDSCEINATVCPENASCNLNTGGCDCDEGWFGENCDSNDSCSDITCVDNASCIEGECFCDEGYELIGEECVATISQYLGVYEQIDQNCESNPGEEYIIGTVTVEAHPTDADKINLINFAGWDHTVYAVVAGNTFTIPEQTPAGGQGEITYIGLTNGTYNVGAAGDILLSIRYRFESETMETCDAVLTKQ